MNIASHLITFVLAIFGTLICDWYIRRRPRLIYWIASYSQFSKVTEKLDLYVYNLTIQNLGRGPARDIKIFHGYFPAEHVNISIYPPSTFKVEPIEGDHYAHQIVIPNLQGKNVMTVQYLSTALISLETFVNRVEYDQGKASYTSMKFIPIPPRWALVLVYLLFFVGLVTIIKFCYVFGPSILNRLWGAII